MRIAVVGASGYGNVGDDTYPLLLRRLLPEHRWQFYNSNRPAAFPRGVDLLVMGGGGLIFCSPRKELAAHFHYMRWYLDAAARRNIPWGFLSCDIQPRASSSGYDLQALRPWKPYLSSAAFLSIRSRAGAEAIRQMTGRHDVYSYPDLCYLVGKLWPRPTAHPRRQVLLVPGAGVRANTEEVSRLLESYLSLGYELVVANFGARSDDAPAMRQARRLYPDARICWDPNPRQAFQLVAQSQFVFAGRYHALVFARAASVPFFRSSSAPFKIREEDVWVDSAHAWGHIALLRRKLQAVAAVQGNSAHATLTSLPKPVAWQSKRLQA